MDRRSSDHNDEPSRRRPSSSSNPNPNVFGDDFEVDMDEDDFMPSVSDGFRPAGASDGGNGDRQNHDRSKPNEGDLRRMATRNSTAKGRDQTQTQLPQDGRRPASPLAHRASVSSTASFATTSNGENPFEASTGPSHPYGMYSQNTMARTPSIATTSTEPQPHRRSMSLHRPTHPYAMYSQSGLDDALDNELPDTPSRPPVPPIQTAVPHVFPALGTGYHRVLGPDGEEQDIIGPDGHTEQLPPYTQYPEEGPTKASLAAAASASRAFPVADPVLDAEDPFNTPASPVSPLSATSFTAPALPTVPLLPSIAPARLPPQRPETQTGTVVPATATYANTVQVPAEPSDSVSDSLLSSEQGLAEKAVHEETKLSWRKKKLFGKVSNGVAVISVLLLIFAIALGAAIGTLATKKHHANKNKGGNRRPSSEYPQSQVTGAHGTLYDATPIPTPSGLGLLPTGAFSLPLGIPQESNPGCLTQANQNSAWSCKLTFAPLVVTINNTQTINGPRQLASMKTGSTADGLLLYGLQSPDISLQSLQLVLDLDYKAYGPAYHFATRYDKLVILRPDELTPGSSPSKREEDKPFRQRFQVKPGDYPWYCHWNQTYIEGYIYVDDNSTAASFTTLLTQPPSGSPSASYDMAGFLATASVPSPSPGTGVVNTSPVVAPPTPAPIPISPRDAQSDAAAPPRIPPYPRIVKIEERRVSDSPQPYCRQMVMLDNGVIAPAKEGNDGEKQIPLQEIFPDYDDVWAARASQTVNYRRDGGGGALTARSDPGSACHCQWMFK